MDQGPVRLRPFPSPTPYGPRTSTTARGIFQIHNSTSDPKTRRDKQSEKDAEGSLGFPLLFSVRTLVELGKASSSVLGGKKNHLFVLYVFIVYIMMLLSKGTETCMNFRYELCIIL